MKKIILPLLLSLLLISFDTNNDFFGKYYTIEKGKTSILELKKNGHFVYTFQRDSFCGGEIEGKYKIINKKVTFENDYEYTEAHHQKFIDSLNSNPDVDANNDTIWYDIAFSDFDMSLVEWKISSNSIKPLNKVETNCFEISSKHTKKNIH